MTMLCKVCQRPGCWIKNAYSGYADYVSFRYRNSINEKFIIHTRCLRLLRQGKVTIKMAI